MDAGEHPEPLGNSRKVSQRERLPLQMPTLRPRDTVLPPREILRRPYARLRGGFGGSGSAPGHWGGSAWFRVQTVRPSLVVNRDKRLVGIVALEDFAVESSEIRPAAEALSEISKPS